MKSFKEYLTEAKKEIEISKSNLIFKGMGIDKNGNAVAKFSFPNGQGFSIQTNQNMPKTHKYKGYRLSDLSDSDIETIGKEAIDYIQKYGSSKQKAGLKTY